jgi:hypothetical protein
MNISQIAKLTIMPHISEVNITNGGLFKIVLGEAHYNTEVGFITVKVKC